MFESKAARGFGPVEHRAEQKQEMLDAIDGMRKMYFEMNTNRDPFKNFYGYAIPLAIGGMCVCVCWPVLYVDSSHALFLGVMFAVIAWILSNIIHISCGGWAEVCRWVCLCCCCKLFVSLCRPPLFLTLMPLQFDVRVPFPHLHCRLLHRPPLHGCHWQGRHCTPPSPCLLLVRGRGQDQDRVTVVCCLKESTTRTNSSLQSRNVFVVIGWCHARNRCHTCCLRRPCCCCGCFLLLAIQISVVLRLELLLKNTSSNKQSEHKASPLASPPQHTYPHFNEEVSQVGFVRRQVLGHVEEAIDKGLHLCRCEVAKGASQEVCNVVLDVQLVGGPCRHLGGVKQG